VSRIAGTFARLQSRGRKALVPYVTAGDPDPDSTVDIMLSMASAGADLIELGVPFSDPMADGPVIQKACERAVARGIGLPHVLANVRGFRARNRDTPLVLMGYANPIERYGIDRFVADAADAGVDGVLVVDYPPEECTAFVTQLKAASLDPIFMLAPTSSDDRIERVAGLAGGYVYYVSLRGVTGAGNLDIAAVASAVPRIKARVKLPVGVGFGIRDARSATAVAAVADAVVIGSALVQLLEACPRDNLAAAAAEFIASIRAALDS
jgi:tryptophan synthase alpha chain